MNRIKTQNVSIFTSVLFFLIFSFHLHAQDLGRAKSNIDVLCASEMYGRGYTNNGDKIAANFIQKHFQEMGLKPFGKNYQQLFTLDVTTFPNPITLQIDNKKLRLGTDYIVSAASGNGGGEAELFWLDTAIFSSEKKQKKLLRKDLSNKMIVYELAVQKKIFDLPKKVLFKILGAKGLIATTKKLTHSIGSYQYPFVAFIVLEAKIKTSDKNVTFKTSSKLIKNYETQNVIGFIEGTSKADSFLVFSAHYDHLGEMGNVYFAGANDNASGIAMLLELAHYYKENPPKYSMVFMAFGAEEAGLIGSKFYTENPKFPLAEIRFLLNLDLFATGEKGLTAVNGSVFKKEFERLKKINTENKYLPLINKRGKAANSDHYFFTEKGVPSFFFYLMGDWKNYHDVDDKTPIPLSKFKEAFRLIVDFADGF